MINDNGSFERFWSNSNKIFFLDIMEDVNNNDKFVNDVCLNEDLFERF